MYSEQIDPSNSGGPLICSATGDVVGVIARRATGLTKQFDAFLDQFAVNIKFLKNAGIEDMIQISGVNFGAELINMQRHMETQAREIQRSANVGIGYAVWVGELSEEVAF